MTFDELKTKIDNYIGIESEIAEKFISEKNLVYKSPTGITLFTIEVSNFNEDGWQFGSQSGGLPNSWKHLCRIHEDK